MVRAHGVKTFARQSSRQYASSPMQMVRRTTACSILSQMVFAIDRPIGADILRTLFVRQVNVTDNRCRLVRSLNRKHTGLPATN